MSAHDVVEPEIHTRSIRNISPVWIVPILAAVIGGLVAWQSYAQRGPLVEIRFAQGHGIEAGKTEIKHKDVVVGLVEDVTLTKDLTSVLVKARMENFVSSYLGETTDFWIVSANISGTNFSGLGTLLSGAYIEVDWVEPAKKRRKRYVGLDTPPLSPPGAQGRHFKLRTDTAGSLSVGSPVFYRRIKVGQIESRHLSDDFKHVEYEAFVEAPYDTLLNQATHFWNVSGLSVEAGTDGLAVKMESLEALLAGGVAFGDIGVTIGTASFDSDTVFPVYANKDAAIESQYESDEDGFLFMAVFDDSIDGLERNAPVEWQGIRIGTVKDIVLDLGQGPKDGRTVYVVLELQPTRIGLENVTEEEHRFAINQWVASGMRLRLESGNLLTGKKVVRFVDDIGIGIAAVDFNAVPYPVLPTAPSEIGAMTQNLEQIIANIAALPLDRLVGSAITLLQDTDNLITSAGEDLPGLIANLNQIADAGEATLAGVAPGSQLYTDLSGAVRELRDASRSLSALAARLERNPNALITGR